MGEGHGSNHHLVENLNLGFHPNSRLLFARDVCSHQKGMQSRRKTLSRLEDAKAQYTQRNGHGLERDESDFNIFWLPRHTIENILAQNRFDSFLGERLSLIIGISR